MTMEKFHYASKSTGKKITLPWINDHFTAGWLRKNRKLTAEEQGWEMLEAAANKDSLDKIDALPIAEFQELMTAWQKGPDGDTTVGEF